MKYGVIINDVSDYINLLVRVAHIICNHPLLCCTWKWFVFTGTRIVSTW
jgi:hypothetical protein